MSLLLLAVIVMAALTGGYALYGTFIARQYRLDDARVTPAVANEDGLDFVPTRPFYLLGQHFSAIAAAGPIVGPIAACVAFGWGPCLLWILLGVIFIGAVHDFSALVASVRHGAHSVAEIAKEHLGRRAWLALVVFIWLALLYVITAFADVTAKTFVGVSEELRAVEGTFNKGGAVAFASIAYLGLALAMGVMQRWRVRGRAAPMWLLTAVFVPATLAVVYLGTTLDNVFSFGVGTWHIAILAYCFVASLLPMWLLQQPRGYLGGFILYIAIGVGLLGVLFGGFTIQQPAFKPVADYSAWFAGGPDAPPATALVFPFLFVTIACGACSGFHGLICGGTTSKQIAKESHCKPIAFGAMLLEGLVAVIALATVMIVAESQTRGKAPGVLYGDGIAAFVTRLLDPRSVTAESSRVFAFAATFGAMAFSTFVFDTLDVSTRLGRYLLTELTGAKGRGAALLASGLTAGVPLAILLSTTGAGYMAYWTLFGTSNQLLAALTLLGVTVWLYRTGRRYWYTLLPMLFVFVITITALAMQIVGAARALASGPAAVEASGLSYRAVVMNGAVAVTLLLLAIVFVAEAWRSVRAFRRERRQIAGAQVAA